MTNTSKHSGESNKEIKSYFDIVKTATPIKSYTIHDLRKRVEEKRKKDAQKE